MRFLLFFIYFLTFYQRVQWDNNQYQSKKFILHKNYSSANKFANKNRIIFIFLYLKKEERH